jgi:hypothetical protein
MAAQPLGSTHFASCARGIEQLKIGVTEVAREEDDVRPAGGPAELEDRLRGLLEASRDPILFFSAFDREDEPVDQFKPVLAQKLVHDVDDFAPEEVESPPSISSRLEYWGSCLEGPDNSWIAMRDHSPLAVNCSLNRTSGR